MDANKVQNSLRQISKIFSSVLADDAERVLQEAAQSVQASKLLYARGSQSVWGYEITHDQPLRFRPSTMMKGIKPVVDIYCDIKWQEGDWPVQQDIKVRVWSEDADIGYREHLDAVSIMEQVTNKERLNKYPGRVILRFHFDRVNHQQGRSEQYHPEYHFQVGGKPEDYELCWHPKGFDLPRIGFHPMELFLTCQLVAVNFFREEYSTISKKAEWKHWLNLYQKSLLYPYYDRCVKILQDKQSLIDLMELPRT